MAMDGRVNGVGRPRRSSRRIRDDEVAPKPMELDHQHTTPARAAPDVARSGTRALYKMRVVHAR